MQLIDYIIIGVYFCALIFLGIYFRRRASGGLEDYFLGGRKIPWWVLGLSGMASNLDMTGTMVIISFFYIIGVKGFFIELRGGVCLAIAFFMIFGGKWHSRAGVLTVAEWMEFRFGNKKQGEAARLLSALSTIILTVGMVAYFFVGTGKFLSLILPFPPQVCSLIMITVALFYTAISGFYGVAYTDLIQSALIGFTIIFMSIKAYCSIDLAMIQSMTSVNWTDILPSWRLNMPEGYEMYNLFGIAIIFYFLKVVVEGFGGPQGYVAQRYFAVNTDRESGMLSAVWLLLLSFRWPFIMAVTILGLTLGPKISDPEMVMPMVLFHLVPSGLKGLVMASLFAAAMSTFDSTINNGASYLVNDIYYKYVNPKASQKQLVYAGYGSSIAIVVLGIIIGLITPSINTIWGWLTMSLGAGMLIPLMLRWYWWRFNGYGFAVGTGIGVLGAILQKVCFPSWPEWMAFIAISTLSFTGMIVCTLLSQSTPNEVLEKFYQRTRPMGFWNRIKQTLDRNTVQSIRKENRNDLIALLFAVPWHISLFLAPVHMILHRWDRFTIFLSIFIFSSIGLYFFWFRFLNVNNSNSN